MLHGLKIAVVMPAYRAARTLAQCYRAIPRDVVDAIVLVDDASDDETLAVARELGLATLRHPHNLGYGANQKTCYREALTQGADIVVMLHPDYQYEPRLITAMAAMIASGVYDVVIGSRIIGNTALRGGMPLYKYVANRVLTALPLLANSQDFVFDNEMLVQAHAFGMRIGEISCPTRYFAEASQIGFRRSLVYGAGVLRVSAQYRLWRMGFAKPAIFSDAPELRLETRPAEPIPA